MWEGGAPRLSKEGRQRGGGRKYRDEPTVSKSKSSPRCQRSKVSIIHDGFSMGIFRSTAHWYLRSITMGSSCVKRAHPVFCSPMILCDQMRDVVCKGSGGACSHFSSFRKYS